jgi:hypothetical protein
VQAIEYSISYFFQEMTMGMSFGATGHSIRSGNNRGKRSCNSMNKRERNEILQVLWKQCAGLKLHHGAKVAYVANLSAVLKHHFAVAWTREKKSLQGVVETTQVGHLKSQGGSRKKKDLSTILNLALIPNQQLQTLVSAGVMNVCSKKGSSRKQNKFSLSLAVLHSRQVCTACTVQRQ